MPSRRARLRPTPLIPVVILNLIGPALTAATPDTFPEARMRMEVGAATTAPSELRVLMQSHRRRGR